LQYSRIVAVRLAPCFGFDKPNKAQSVTEQARPKQSAHLPLIASLVVMLAPSLLIRWFVASFRVPPADKEHAALLAFSVCSIFEVWLNIHLDIVPPPCETIRPFVFVWYSYTLPKN
jgi:hypothetical protein